MVFARLSQAPGQQLQLLCEQMKSGSPHPLASAPRCFVTAPTNFILTFPSH